MCGLIVEKMPILKIRERFKASGGDFNFTPSNNIRPTSTIPVIVAQQNERQVVPMKWGFILKDRETGRLKPVFNATAEKVATSPFFRGSLVKRRCLIPASGFVEWPKYGKERQPLLYQLSDEELFAFAGMWTTYHVSDKEVWQTCTIITTTPNGLVAQIHNRMPVILPKKEEATWLDESITEAKELTKMLRPFPAEKMFVENAPLPPAKGRTKKEG